MATFSLLLAQGAPARLLSLSSADLLIIVVYFAAVLAIGFYLKRHTKTGEDFFLAGREMTAWVAGLSFLAANLGSLELMGWAAAAYQYGILATHWYWIGAIPAMLFLGIVMMPFYYISKTHSVPGYLMLRFGEPSRALSAISFAFMTVLMSGINMYSMALVMKVVLGWDIHFSIWVSSLTVALYVSMGGLLSAIFNEVLQFVLIWLGAMLVPIIGLIEAGGWNGMVERISRNFPGQNFTNLWSTMGSFTDNPMGIHWTGIVLGLGWVISFGYWPTDFLVVQRVLAAKDLRSAKFAPIIGAAFKMMVPFIVILPGIAAVALMKMDVGYAIPVKGDGYNYDLVLTTLMAKFYPAGMLGVGITGLMASFMSGMAGNVTAFNTVWTYDIYQSYIRRDAPDSHYLWVGRLTTVFGVLLSIGTAYLAQLYNNIMDLLQLVFGFVNAPLFATFLLGMFWKRATGHGAFCGLLAGTSAATLTHGLTIAEGKGGWLGTIHEFPSTMAQNFWVAIFAWTACFLVTIAVSLVTRPRPAAELGNLVYGLTKLPHDEGVVWYKRPVVIAVAAGVMCLLLNFIFW